MDFRFNYQEEAAYFDTDTKEIYIHLKYVDSISYLYYLIEHEVLHSAIDKCTVSVDDDEEHQIIHAVQWAEFNT